MLVKLSVIASQIVATTATTIWTLTKKASLVCDSSDNVFSKNNFNGDFVRRNTHGNADFNTQTNGNSGPVTTAYTLRTPEAPLTLSITRILQPYNKRIAHKPINTVRRLVTIVKDKGKPED